MRPARFPPLRGVKEITACSGASSKRSLVFLIFTSTVDDSLRVVRLSAVRSLLEPISTPVVSSGGASAISRLENAWRRTKTRAKEMAGSFMEIQENAWFLRRRRESSNAPAGRRKASGPGSGTTAVVTSETLSTAITLSEPVPLRL